MTYLLYVAISFDGDWVDGLVLESLFDFVTEIDTTDLPDVGPVSRMEYGLECHRELSLTDWKRYRTRLLIELEDDLNKRYVGKVAKIEERLNETRQQMLSSESVEFRNSLAQDRASLRTALLDAEATEGEATQFLIRLQAQQPEYELKDLFCIEWTVKAAVQRPSKKKNS
jgi:hypothetical protein